MSESRVVVQEQSLRQNRTLQVSVALPQGETPAEIYQNAGDAALPDSQADQRGGV